MLHDLALALVSALGASGISAALVLVGFYRRACRTARQGDP